MPGIRRPTSDPLKKDTKFWACYQPVMEGGDDYCKGEQDIKVQDCVQCGKRRAEGAVAMDRSREWVGQFTAADKVDYSESTLEFIKGQYDADGQ